MKNDAHRVTQAGSYAADAVAEIDAIGATRALYRTMAHGEDDGIALLKRDDFGPRLHARALFGQDELAAREVVARLRQQDRHLDRERVLAVEILVQAVIVVSLVLQDQRRGAPLAGRMTTFDEGRVGRGVACIDRHRLIPSIGNRYEVRIETGTKRRDERRQRIGKISVLALAEAVPAHDDTAAIKRFRIVTRRQRAASGRWKQCRNDGAAMRIEFPLDAIPIGGIDLGERSADKLDAGDIIEIAFGRVASDMGGHAQRALQAGYRVDRV